MVSDLFLKRLNFCNSAPENTVFKNMKLHQTGSLFKLLICREEYRQLSNGEGETEVERSMSQKEKAIEKLFWCSVLKWKCFWRAPDLSRPHYGWSSKGSYT